ncbi:MAG TPA: hypothetical protein VE261_00345 [Gaiellaceae bacterium]|nr:hypothetical protein [Gaiellaceae bacterium]
MTAVREGTYRSACGRLLHRWIDGAGHAYWETEEQDGTRHAVEMADTAQPVLLSDDPMWPCDVGSPREPVLITD